MKEGNSHSTPPIDKKTKQNKSKQICRQPRDADSRRNSLSSPQDEFLFGYTILVFSHICTSDTKWSEKILC